MKKNKRTNNDLQIIHIKLKTDNTMVKRQKIQKDKQRSTKHTHKTKNRQHNGQKKKKYKRTNNDLQNIHIKLKIEYLERCCCI